ncbi:hypothetical protein BD410DRAFT_779582 [Rickenella mellea]|uniref:Cytoplasmic protein n=1 Tax=Rickenella mellea TaxID=50990 RepID=A0A4R5XE20_9AGAM|nr:hypothetical protein BD410DRAFT_779582 [Rickenella mellea]
MKCLAAVPIIALPVLLATQCAIAAPPDALAARSATFEHTDISLVRRHDDELRHGHEHEHHTEHGQMEEESGKSIDNISPAPQPDPHSHSHHLGEPLKDLNETLILQYHLPTPPSYETHDFEDPDVESKFPGLMVFHAILMSSAFFLVLPVGIALRSVKHSWHGLSVAIFYVLVAFGVSTSALYSKLTPNLYEGSTHGKHGWSILFLAVALTVLDIIAIGNRSVAFITAVRGGEQKFVIKLFWRNVILGRIDEDPRAPGMDHEYSGLVDEPEEIDMQDPKVTDTVGRDYEKPEHKNNVHDDATARWANSVHQHRRQRGSEWRQSIASDATLFHHPMSPSRSRHSEDTQDTLHDFTNTLNTVTKTSRWRRIGETTFASLERLLVFLGYAVTLSGIVVYTGACRDSYVNGCLAHLIKGGIFWCYGLITFARFLGAFADFGWAWNRSPRTGLVSAEFIESFVIFFYGITNTWMERFGVEPGTPFSTKEVQHISIAVMFWFAGLLGMSIESKRFRRWFSALATSRLPAHALQQPIAEPLSYSGSFNPFPALVIGVTGAAMSAHAQVYLFQVQIHVLWGSLLVAFSVLRCLTYFFVWLGPPTSILPSRPPTEALASFFLACGGLMFQFSTEELTLTAMRRGHNDQMMFLNVAVAVTCLAFCWSLCIVAFNGWLKLRKMHSVV